MIIQVSNLRKTYAGNAVVKDISFSVQEKEIFGILGPNGAGKTTTLEMIEAMRPIEKGSVKVAGINVKANPQRVKRVIGIQPQSTAFMDNLSLREILRLFAASYGTSVDPLVLLKDVQLAEKAGVQVKTLSGGQKQRFSIACALVHEPKVLFLDEPTTGLDPQARLNLWSLIRSIRDRGITVVITTHYMEEASQLCDRVAIMDSGEIIALNSPKQLIHQLLKRGFKKKQEVERANLEDVFIDLTGKDLRE